MIPIMLWHPAQMTVLCYATWGILGLCAASGWLAEVRTRRRHRLYRTARERLAISRQRGWTAH